MKILKYMLTATLLAVILTGCDEGIDPITNVAPGPDQAPPAVTIAFSQRRHTDQGERRRNAPGYKVYGDR